MKTFILKIRLSFSIFTVLYAVSIVQQFASRSVSGGENADVLHVMFWTLAPPLWFMLEWWATPPASLANLKDNQEKAGKA